MQPQQLTGLSIGQLLSCPSRLTFLKMPYIGAHAQALAGRSMLAGPEMTSPSGGISRIASRLGQVSLQWANKMLAPSVSLWMKIPILLTARTIAPQPPLPGENQPVDGPVVPANCA
jgi:hypothetical protein